MFACEREIGELGVEFQTLVSPPVSRVERWTDPDASDVMPDAARRVWIFSYCEAGFNEQAGPGSSATTGLSTARTNA